MRVVIHVRDRMGITMDVLSVLYEYDFNIITMEVYPGIIYARLDWAASRDWGELARALNALPGVREVARTELLPSERREQQLKAVLNSVSEGIIAIDAQGLITLINPAAEKILQCPENTALGRPAREVLSPDVPMLKALTTGRSYDHEEMIVNTDQGRSHYVTTGRPIKNDSGQVTGMVAALKDMSQVRDLVYSITRPSMVTFEDIIAQSPVMKNVISLAKTVAGSHSTVLLRGESGTGKELFSRAIHMASPRRNKPFVPVNCAAIPDSLLESELFGYEGGAFTGAQRSGKQGLFEFAHQGTLFLDEIGELSPHLQAKLLRVLQEGKVRRIGGSEEVFVDVRIIAATSRNLEEMLKQGTFREDLYYRLNVIPLFLPPLRERGEDIPVLAQNFIDKLNRLMAAHVRGIAPAALKRLAGYSWPGNVRELANVIERAINLAPQASVLELPHLLLTSGEMHGMAIRETESKQGEITVKADLAGKTLAEQVAEVEEHAIRRALARHKSSRAAGQALGVSHTTILKKMKKYRLSKPEAFDSSLET